MRLGCFEDVLLAAGNLTHRGPARNRAAPLCRNSLISSAASIRCLV